MSVIAEAIKILVEHGVTGDAIVTAIDRLTAAEAPKRSAGAERQRRYRERKSHPPIVTSDVTSDVTGDVTGDVTKSSFPQEKKVPPDPLKETQPPTTKTSVGAASIPEHPSLQAAAERIWALQPIVGGKRRSTRPDVRKALDAAARTAPAELIEAAAAAYYALPDCKRDGGQFAKGAQVLLREGRWREFLPGPAVHPRRPSLTDAQRAWAVQHFQDTGEWKDEWGERPDIGAAA